MILAFIALSFMEIFVDGRHNKQIKRLSQNFFILLLKILAAIHKIYIS